MKISFKHEIKPADKLTSVEIVNLILKERKIKDIKKFLNPDSPLHINLLHIRYGKEVEKTLKILKEIKKNNQIIVVYTDYDADGITGGAILWETLYLLGFKVMPYVPHRHHEGYGFSIKGIDNVKKQFNPALIISVDHGITKVKEVAYAQKLGIKIIITDHHLKSEKIPKANAIFHIPALSGSGVAYFFSKMIFESLRTSEVKLMANFETDYLVLASIGTIADLVPLVGPSRSIVKFGLDAFSKVKRYGLRHILKEAGIEDKKITPYEVGFIIAPRINAVGRLEHAIDALRLLCTTNENRAKDLASHLGKVNRVRQDELTKSLAEAEKMLVKRHSGEETKSTTPESLSRNYDSGQAGMTQLSKIIILVSETWHEGIIGLIASKIAEKYFRPTLVLTKADGFYKGSARSIPSFDITGFLRNLKTPEVKERSGEPRGLNNLLVDVGGHKAAAGFTIEKDKLNNFETIVLKLADKIIKDKDLERKIEADLKIPLAKINLKLAYELEKLAPFGMGNPTPTFLSEGEITGAQVFGKKSEHLKIFASSPNYSLEFIAFNQADKFKNLSRKQKINIVYRLGIDRFGGKEKLRGIVISLQTLLP